MSSTMSRPVYHVRHDLQPALTEELLVLFWDKSPCRLESIREAAAERGYRVAQRSPDQLITSLVGMKLLARSERAELSLSNSGQLLARPAKYAPTLVPELIHFTYYTLYNAATQAPRFSWAYRLVCDQLWSIGDCEIDAHRLIVEVQEQAQQFADYAEYGVSFSQNSVAGVVNWLEALDPPAVVTGEHGARTFRRRTFYPVETVLLALEYACICAESERAGLQLHLTPAIRTQVARVCLVDPAVLGELIPATAEAFGLLHRQTERGDWLTLPGDRSPLPFSAWSQP